MKPLWTPWRMEHVLGKEPRSKNCIFEPTGHAPSDKSQLLLYRGAQVVILLNRYPYSNGHLLVAPVRHIASLTDLSEPECGALLSAVQKSTSLLQKHLNPDGFNIGCNIGTTAGAGIADHLHFHIVPRWDGDHNFICVLADTRTIPEHIDATFDRLAADFLTFSNHH